MSRIFEARYNGRCAACDGRIQTGEDVTYLDDELVHASCTTGAVPAARETGQCPSCFTALPVTGVCGVCE